MELTSKQAEDTEISPDTLFLPRLSPSRGVAL